MFENFKSKWLNWYRKRKGSNTGKTDIVVDKNTDSKDVKTANHDKQPEVKSQVRIGSLQYDLQLNWLILKLIVCLCTCSINLILNIIS